MTSDLKKALLVILLAVLGGCAEKVEKLEITTQDLSSQLAELQKSYADVNRRLEEIGNNIFILQDRVDRNRQQIKQQEKKSKLKIIKVQPQPSNLFLDEPRIPAPPPRPPAPARKPTPTPTGTPESVSTPPPAPTAKPISRIIAQEVKKEKDEAKRRKSAERVALPRTPPLVKSAAVAGLPPSLAKLVPRGPKALYQGSLKAYEETRYDESIAGFREFVRRWPWHDYADNSQYWIGECYYSRDDFDEAVDEWEVVLNRYPNGNKAPDALLKIGYSYGAQDKKKKALEVLRQVVDLYPFSDAAVKAEDLIDKLSAR